MGDLCEQDSVYDECDVVSNKHSRDEVIGLLIESCEAFLGDAAFLLVDLCEHLIRCHKCNFHSREECGEYECDDECYHDVCGLVFGCVLFGRSAWQ